MNKAILLSCIFLGTGLLPLRGQEPPPQPIFTAAQAEAGRVVTEKTCGQCHTQSLLGRKGDPGESPELSSLSEAYRKFIGPRGTAPPLTGPAFVQKWGWMTAAQLIARFQETVDSFNIEPGDKEATVNVTAYVLRLNGAKPGTRLLTRDSKAIVNSVVR